MPESIKTKKEILENDPYASPESESIQPPEEISRYVGKVYNPLSIAIATIFGSVLAGGLLLYSNFSHFERKTGAIVIAVLTAILTIFFLFAMLVINFPGVLLFLGVNFLIGASLLPLAQVLLARELEQHEELEREFHSFSRAILMGVGCSFAMGLMLFFAYSMFLMVF